MALERVNKVTGETTLIAGGNSSTMRDGVYTVPVSCAIGDTSVEITNLYILETSIIDVYPENASGYIQAVSRVAVEYNKATLYFSALQEATNFRLKIVNLQGTKVNYHYNGTTFYRIYDEHDDASNPTDFTYNVPGSEFVGWTDIKGSTVPKNFIEAVGTEMDVYCIYRNIREINLTYPANTGESYSANMNDVDSSVYKRAYISLRLNANPISGHGIHARGTSINQIDWGQQGTQTYDVDIIADGYIQLYGTSGPEGIGYVKAYTDNIVEP